MKIIVEHAEGKKEVFQYVSDAYLCVRREVPVSDGEDLSGRMETRSWSWGSDIRELVKELRQSLVELEDILRQSRLT